MTALKKVRLIWQRIGQCSSSSWFLAPKYVRSTGTKSKQRHCKLLTSGCAYLRQNVSICFHYYRCFAVLEKRKTLLLQVKLGMTITAMFTNLTLIRVLLHILNAFYLSFQSVNPRECVRLGYFQQKTCLLLRNDLETFEEYYQSS